MVVDVPVPFYDYDGGLVEDARLSPGANSFAGGWIQPGTPEILITANGSNCKQGDS